MASGDKPGGKADEGKRRGAPPPAKMSQPAAPKPGDVPQRATVPRGRLRLGRDRPGRRGG